MLKPLRDRFILVIDHSTITRLPLCRLMRDLGARKVVETSNAREALEAFKVYTSMIEAVVCERDLPKVDGLAVLKAIRQGRTPLDRATPMLLLASDDDRQVRKAFQALDGTALLPRPVSPARIAELLAQALEKPAPVQDPAAYAEIDITARDKIVDKREGGPSARELAEREAKEKAEREEMAVAAFAVTDGMVLVRDLVSAKGAKLMKFGDSLTAAAIAKLIDRGDLTHDSEIWVRRDPAEREAAA